MTKKLTLYPAIDLKNGACVRLKQGRMEDATHYSNNPAHQAKLFEDSGCDYLHVVDLDGAFEGKSANIAAVKSILSHISIPIELGGGIRTLSSIENWLNAGITRIILGSVAVTNPALVKEAAKRWPNKIVAGIDARHGYVATEGWAEETEMKASELAIKMQDCGVSSIIFTEITRDGMLDGLAFDEIEDIAQKVSIPVIASGGVGSLKDLIKLKEYSQRCKNIDGVIVGRALYDGRISLKDALEVLN